MDVDQRREAVEKALELGVVLDLRSGETTDPIADCDVIVFQLRGPRRCPEVPLEFGIESPLVVLDVREHRIAKDEENVCELFAGVNRGVSDPSRRYRQLLGGP